MRRQRVILVSLLGLFLGACGGTAGAPASLTSPGAGSGVSDLFASRYTWLYGGSPGGVTPSVVAGTHLQVPCTYGKCFQPGLQTAGAVVSPSPATSGAQTVLLHTLTFKEDRVFGGWTQEGTPDSQQVTIASGIQSARFTDDQWLPNTGGAKQVAFTVLWSDVYGQRLGWQLLVMNEARDYVCHTDFTLYCTVGDGFVSVVEPN